MGDLNSPFIAHSQTFKEIFVDPLPECFVFLNFMIGFREGTATSAAKGAEGKALFFSKGQITGSH
jgi:hypothetical protein